MVEGLPEHPAGSHRGSWGTSVSFREANRELHGENGTKQARCEVHLDVAKGGPVVSGLVKLLCNP